MPNLDIDSDTIKNIKELFAALEEVGVDFIPQFLKDLDDNLQLDKAKVTLDEAKQPCEIDFKFGIKIAEAEKDEDEPRYLKLGMNISIKPGKGTGGKRTAEYGVMFEIPLSTSTPKSLLHFEGQVSAALHKTLVLQCKIDHEQAIPLHTMLGDLAPGLSTLIPEELTIPFGQTLLAVIAAPTKRGGGRRFLLGVGFNAEVNFGDIPVVGLYFKEEQTRAELTLQLLLSTGAFKPDEIKELNEALGKMSSPVVIRSSSSKEQGLERGAYLIGYAAIGDIENTWYMPLKRQKSRTPSSGRPQASGRSLTRSSAEATPLVTVRDNYAWIAIERAVGPVHLEKIGLSYRDGAAEIVPEIVISLGDLRLIFEGITIRFPISPLGLPAFRLDGFGIEYKNDSLLVSGAFLRSRGDGYTDYAGSAAIQLKLKGSSSIGIAAIGAYARPEGGGDPSLFLYASLNFPLGGPPFFFVTGLSGGFGYNRDLVSPEMEDVAEFPLVSQAMNGVGAPDTDDPGDTIAGQLSELGTYIPIAPGTGFLAAGIKFTSFKMIEGFALLTLVLGERFEIGMLGLARLQVPPKSKNTLVMLEVALQMRFAPTEGVILVRGQLTENSWLLSESCKLTGGFAVGIWFSGDFVLTIGGYHPRYVPPSYYPTVPRVGLNWRIGSTFTIRGEAYFALCAHAFMVGMSVEASFKAGLAFASFHIGADFLISWKPYAYDINLRCHFKAGFGILKASLGAELHLWGPEFGGTAKIKVIFFSFTIKFGNQSSPLPEPITWGTFRETFLPADNEVCSIAVAEGLTRQIKSPGGQELWVVNPKELALVTDSVIPSMEATHPGVRSPERCSSKFGVAPVGVKAGELTSEHRLSIYYGDKEVDPGKFKISTLTRQAPTALWGEPNVQMVKGKERLRLPDVNGPAFVEGAFSGLRIEPAEVPKGGATCSLSVKVLSFDPVCAPKNYAFSALPAFRAAAGDDDERRAKIGRSIAGHAARDALLATLGFDPRKDVILHAGIAETFVIPPQVKDTLAAA